MKDSTLDNLARDVYRALARKWESPYVGGGMLSPSELILLRRHAGRWHEQSMLDIGIGVGRTTAVFARITKHYVGIDFSTEMIEAATQYFPELPPDTLQVADARDLSRFEESSFDTVFFSYNGIDHVPFSERPKVLREVRRVLRPGGLFVFSSHCMWALYPRPWPMPWKQRLRYIRMNPDIFIRKRVQDGFMVVREGEPGRGGTLLYVDPHTQFRQLTEEGFTSIEARDRAGSVVPLDKATLKAMKWQKCHMWLHYFCLARNS